MFALALVDDGRNGHHNRNCLWEFTWVTSHVHYTLHRALPCGAAVRSRAVTEDTAETEAKDRGDRGERERRQRRQRRQRRERQKDGGSNTKPTTNPRRLSGGVVKSQFGGKLVRAAASVMAVTETIQIMNSSARLIVFELVLKPVLCAQL
ncbi:unnamed protein product [Pleuronectes platessa]|uniref:Uncharacterized protein n=1 Tax=Pleuronectes platessa TaxID=8262 RepID=A0A9N7Y9L8_PLEPL|nr:unnamed protein product [Pleuronectes platessa]